MAMPKGVIERSGGRTAASDLRDMLRELEVAAGDLVGKGEQILDILRLRDRVQEEIQRLLEQGLTLKPEQSRLETVDSLLTRHADVIEKELRKTGGLAAAREAEQPSEDRTWWFVDVPYYQNKKKRSRSTWIAVGIIAIVFVAAAYVSNMLFGPGTKAERTRTHFVNGQQYVARQEWDKAIEEFERALRIDSNRADAHVYLGVLYEITGRQTEARDQFTRAQSGLRNRRTYLETLANAYEEAGELDLAIGQLGELIATQPTHAQAHLQRAEIYARLGNAEDAASDFATAAELADQQNNTEVFNQASLRLNIMLRTLTPDS